MDPLHPQPALDDFFAAVAAAPHAALLLDYDGTLAPFRAERDEAFPYPGVRELLRRLIGAGRTRVVVISGRSVDDLVRLLDVAPLPELWGSHGWERRLPDGRYLPPELSATARAGLERAVQALESRGLAHALEQKPAGVALHWRGLDARTVPHLREEVGQAWAPIVVGHGLRVHPFDGGLELRVPGRDKGSAVQMLLAELGAAPPLAFLGDDLTDEDAFQCIGDRGLCVLVRPERRPSAAPLWLRPPDELLAFLERWAALDEARIAPTS